MKSDLLGRLSFEHGRVSYPLVYTSPAPNQGNLPARLGPLTGTYDAASGTIRITVPTARIDGIGAGATLLGVESRTFIGRNDGLPINQNISSDFSPAGSYTTVGNASCRQPPAAPTALSAGPDKKAVALRWTDNSNDETAFLVERSTTATGGFVQIGSVGVNTVSYVDATALRRTTYFYRVRAAGGTARSAYTNVAGARAK
jgi:hypothetical protein